MIYLFNFSRPVARLGLTYKKMNPLLKKELLAVQGKLQKELEVLSEKKAVFFGYFGFAMMLFWFLCEK